ncbi:hypothetical protein [Herbaspirillum rubrisubalbicans]|uniref:hypothetical protein n=1 Tax=Herbaspirillum rubrisubalbicans TaxID=80842 RepID=UPI0015EBC5F2|nr:hypothetical protein [Herbaspirillum rubrisubalbicans]
MTIDSPNMAANSSSEGANGLKTSSESVARGGTTTVAPSIKVTLSTQTSQTPVDGLQKLYSPADLAQKSAALAAGKPSTQGGILPPPDVAGFMADAALPRGELYAKYEKAVATLRFPNQAAIDLANAEVPRSDDPARLAQAEQATAYVHGKGSSPFSGLTRNELGAIYYDYSGRYTSNERLAAAGQMNEMDKQFWGPLVARGNATGDWRAVMEAGLAAYDAALPIEKMKSPANYKQLVERDLAYFNNKENGPIDEKKKESLLEMLNALYQKQTEKKNSEDTAAAGQTQNWSKVWAQLALRSEDSETDPSVH